MSKSAKVLVTLASFLSFCVLCIGFAALQDDLIVEGKVSYKGEECILVEGMTFNEVLYTACKEQFGMVDVKINDTDTVSTPNVNQIVFQVDDNFQLEDTYLGYPRVKEITVETEIGVAEAEAKETIEKKIPVKIDQYGYAGLYVDTVTKTIYIFSDRRIFANENSDHMFNSLVKPSAIQFDTKFDTSRVTDMSNMFNGCHSLTSLDVSGFDTSNVTTMSYMFADCHSLSKIDGFVNSTESTGSKFNTSNVENMSTMFYGCYALTSLDLSIFNTAKVTDMSNMFGYCAQLSSVDVSSFDTSSVNNMSAMFRGCRALYTFVFKAPSVTEGSEATEDAEDTNLNALTFNTGLVTDMSFMFEDCNVLKRLDLSAFNTENVLDMTAMFRYCYALESLDVSSFDTGRVTNMTYMFRGCWAIERLTVSSFDTENVTNMSHMFENCFILDGLIVSNFNTGNVTDMSNMFAGCKALTQLDVSNFDTSKVTTMKEMFAMCNSLTGLTLLPDSSSGLQVRFVTSNVTNMEQMFYNCWALQSLNLSGFNTSKVETMKQMFESCKALTSLDLSTFNMCKVNTMEAMFQSCIGLATFIAPMHWENSGVKNMSYAFYECTSLTNLDLSRFNTSSVTNMHKMFAFSTALQSLDLSSFTMGMVQDMTGMFFSCPNLQTIYAQNWELTSECQNQYIFYQNSVVENGVYVRGLKGGQGTEYHPQHWWQGKPITEVKIDEVNYALSDACKATYAHIDGGTTNPGYFTQKTAA